MANLKLSDIDVKFSRNRTDSLLVKVQALQGQLDAGIDPLTAIKTCDIYADPQQVWVDSKPYIEEKRKTAVAPPEPAAAPPEGNNNAPKEA